MKQTHVLRSLGTLPGGVGLFAIALLNTITEFAAWVAVLIVAFEQGGYRLIAGSPYHAAASDGG